MQLQDTAMEAALLGTILRDNTAMDDLELSEAHFSVPFHSRVWRAMGKIISQGGSADLLTVNAEVDDSAALSALTTSGHVNVTYYAERIRELYRLRRLRAMASVIQEKLDSEDSGEILSYIEAQALQVSESKSGSYSSVRDTISDALGRIQKRYESRGNLTGVPTGLGVFDQMTMGLQETDYVVVAARPSVGKTAIALQMLMAAADEGIACGMFSAEMSKELLVERMLTSRAFIDGGKLRSGHITDKDMSELALATGVFYDQSIFVNDTANIRIDALISDARRMKRKESIGILFIDYIGLIGHERPGVARHEQISEISRRIKGLSRELQVPVVVLAQINREGHNAVPNIAQLRDSGSIEQDADIIAMLHRIEKGPEIDKIDMLVEKHRNGACGVVPLAFNKKVMRFYAREQD